MQESNKLIIVGIDPGTTCGYAIVSLDGRLLKVQSSKLFDFNSLLSKITSYGKVLLVGCDKEKAPDFVEKFAIKSGAKLIVPDHDLLVEEKKEITKRQTYHDDHQMDALACALYAQSTIKRLLKKIDIFVQKEKKDTSLLPAIRELVLTKNISIRSACGILDTAMQKEQQEQEAQIDKNSNKNSNTEICQIKSVTAENEPTSEQLKQLKEQYLRLMESLRRLQKESKLLHSQKQKIESELLAAKSIINKQNKKANPQDKDLALKIRDRTIASLQNLCKKKENECESLKKVIQRTNMMLSVANNCTVLKKLDSLGSVEYEQKNKVISITAGDILLVNDPCQYSRNVLDSLKGKVRIIVCNKKPPRKLEQETSFLFISASHGLILAEDRYFACAGRHELEKLIDKSEMLDKIITEYQKERAY